MTDAAGNNRFDRFTASIMQALAHDPLAELLETAAENQEAAQHRLAMERVFHQHDVNEATRLSLDADPYQPEDGERSD